MAGKSPKPFHNTELSAFCRQMALLLSSGASPLESMTLVGEDLEDSALTEAFQFMCAELELGGPLAPVLERSDLFPPYFLRMVHMGESAGRSDEVFSSLAQYYEEEERISQDVRHAVFYPSVMVLLMLGVVLVLVWKVLPVFDQVFSQLGAGLSGFSGSMTGLGQGIAAVAAVLLGLLCLFLGFALFLFRSPKGAALRGKLSSRLFFVRKISQEISAGRFAFVMSVALSSGLDTDRSMEFAQDVVENPLVQGKIQDCRERLARGESFPHALGESGIFSGVYTRMASAAFRAGSLDSTMADISKSCQEEALARMNRAVSLIEPTLVAALSILVGAILLSVILPLMGVMAGL